MAHPVGIVVPFANTVDPNTLGGTWERFAKGRTLVGVNENDANFNTVKKTGGSSTVTLTDKQIASHRHGISGDLVSFTSANNGNVTMNKGTNFGSLYSLNADTNTGWAGNGEAHNNLQPYETVYYWIRTA